MKTIFLRQAVHDIENPIKTKIGTLMEVVSGEEAINGHILLRTYYGIVSLMDPSLTWSEQHNQKWNLRCRKLNKDEIVSLHND